MNAYQRSRQGGQVFVVVALSLAVLAGAVGLAVDSGIGYLVKAKLNAATDAAAVAGARAVTQGRTRDEQRAAAVAAADIFFAANYPEGFLGSGNVMHDTTVGFDNPQPGSITVDVSARTAFPVTFMGVMGFNLLDVAASSQTIRKDLDMAFVMDTSSSMQPVATEVRQQAGAFLDRFNASTDRISLIHFSIGAEVDVPIRTGRTRGFDRPGMVADINALDFHGLTNSTEGLWHGRDQLNRIAVPDRSTLRVIVFFSDGMPNTLASYYKLNPSLGCKSAGAISTGDSDTAGEPSGLWDYTRQAEVASGKCDQGSNITNALGARGLPDWYNAHDKNEQEIPIITSTPRVVTNDTSTPEKAWVNINRASKNVVEALAAKARAEGIHIFTLGLGHLLKTVSAADAAPNDTGENLLKCLSNTNDAPSRCRTPSQPTGVYCHALTAADLEPCFATLAAEILRITR
ncbi:VWA domain-containing protein [Herbaspirillum sp. HC18]|nr:VWA domain-containing protein [Herbaspirillum sp. HC18]